MIKNIFLSLIVIALFVVGCQTDQPIPAASKFVEKNYAPTNEQEVRNKVETFLSHVSSDDVSFRNTFPDTEVNEARWTMEGSANYVTNANLPDNSTTNAKIYTLLIDNTTANNELRMVGSDMTSKFSDLFVDIQAEESQSGKVAMAVDMKLNSVSGTESEVEARVIYGENLGNNPSAIITWAAAAIDVTFEINELLTNPGCIWTPDVDIYVWEDNGAWIQCYGEDGTNQECLSENIEPTSAEYEAANVPIDTQVGLAIGQEFIDVRNISNPDGSTSSTPWVLTSMTIFHHDEYNISVYEQLLYIGVIVGAKASYCY